MNIVGEFAHSFDDEEADALLVEIASLEMQAKLEKKRDEGRGGWHTPEANNAALLKMLKAHVSKGDMVDVMNLAAMIHIRRALYGDRA